MENLITQVLVKMLLFVTNKVFCEIIVWLHVDLHILHTVTAWDRQATESTKTHMKILFSKTQVVSCDFINIYIGQMYDKSPIHRVFKWT